MRLHSLEIPVLDLDRAFAFYARVLEFPIVRRGEDSATFFLGDVHGGMVSLVRVPADEVGAGPGLVFFAEGGVPEKRSKLEAKGVQFLGPTETRGLGPTARFLDSEGNRLAICEPSLTVRLRFQAERPLSDLRADLKAAAVRAREVTSGVSEAQGRHQPAPGEWAITDQVGHIVDSLSSGLSISRDLAAGRQPFAGALWRESYPSDSLPAVLRAMRRAFSDADAALQDFPVSPDVRATLPHGVFGPLNCKGWVAFTLFHVGMHLGQIEAIKGSSGYPTR